MKRPRLIKREELMREEQKEVEPAALISSASVSMNIEEVRKWIHERQSKSAPDARSAFSALFAQS